MELIIYGFAALGALTLLLLAGLVIADFSRPEEPRHVDPDLLVEMPPNRSDGEDYGRRRSRVGTPESAAAE